jgi:hypothetical protein
MVIIAGYESELKECFFAYNQGLESRFTWRFKTGQYNGKELYDIFMKKVAIILLAIGLISCTPTKKDYKNVEPLPNLAKIKTP